MKTTLFLIPLFAAMLLIAAGPAAEAGKIDDLYRLDRLPAFKNPSRIGAFSSYDRTGGNDDGFSGTYSFLRKEDDGLVLADLKGPGVIYRVWTPTPTDDVMEFYFDGEDEPRISVKFREIFLGEHPAFPSPLVGFGAGGYYSYVPLPFEESCIVRVRAPKLQFYQINYALYDSGADIETFSAQPTAEYLKHRETACALWADAGADISRFAAPPKAEIHTARTEHSIPPNGSAVLFSSERGGRIVGLRISPSRELSAKARDLILKISFDGDAPAVECPLGDFFGYGWGKPAMTSLLVGTDQESNYCYLPMPYRNSVRVELLSERNQTVGIQAEVQHCDVPRSHDEGQLYAIWRRENPTTVGKPYTLLETEGRGHMVGVILQCQGFESGKTLYFEGDDQTTIDGALVIHGTGSEDFFNGGWYDVPDRWEKRISFPLSGCLGYDKHLGRTGAYRFFLADCYPYQEKILQTIEHGGENNSIPTDYSSVTFLYSDERPTMPALAPAAPEERAVVDMDEVMFPAWWQIPVSAWSFNNASLTRKREMIGGAEVRYLALQASGGDFFGHHFYAPTVDIPVTGRYAIYIESVTGPDQAIVQLFRNENPVAPPVDLYSKELAVSNRLLLGHLDLVEGKNNLMIKLVDKNPESSSLGFNLVHLFCVRAE
ncbi:MAG: DUF2961 domain-containing protein [Verrucomicrobiota bacterium]|nr:DUF2961 domain-containing protein [Verrucomicrobiota bacterium]